jgi:hypothetical protein
LPTADQTCPKSALESTQILKQRQQSNEAPHVRRNMTTVRVALLTVTSNVMLLIYQTVAFCVHGVSALSLLSAEISNPLYLTARDLISQTASRVPTCGVSLIADSFWTCPRMQSRRFSLATERWPGIWRASALRVGSDLV